MHKDSTPFRSENFKHVMLFRSLHRKVWKEDMYIANYRFFDGLAQVALVQSIMKYGSRGA